MIKKYPGLDFSTATLGVKLVRLLSFFPSEDLWISEMKAILQMGMLALFVFGTSAALACNNPKWCQRSDGYGGKVSYVCGCYDKKSSRTSEGSSSSSTKVYDGKRRTGKSQ